VTENAEISDLEIYAVKIHSQAKGFRNVARSWNYCFGSTL